MNEWKKNIELHAQNIVDSLYIGDSQHVARYYSNNMRWITTDYEKDKLKTKKDFDEYIYFLSKQKVGIVHKEYNTNFITEHAILVIGSYYTVGRDKTLHNMALLFVRNDSIKMKYLQISQRMPENNKYWIKGLDEKLYQVYERNLLYLESNHNHVMWHCRDRIIEAVGTLKKAQTLLSSKFIRIHKGFIIQKKYVVRIGRCFVEMDNGDSISVPEKKYVGIKNQLLET